MCHCPITNKLTLYPIDNDKKCSDGLKEQKTTIELCINKIEEKHEAINNSK